MRLFFFDFADVALGVLVRWCDASDVGGLKSSESDGYVVPQLEPGVAAEVCEALALFFSHVVAVGLVGFSDCVIPSVAAHLMIRYLRDRVADVVVIAYRVFGLIRRVEAVDAFSHPQQLWIEQLLLSLGMDLEKCGEPIPDSTQRRSIGAVDLFQNREEPPLLMVVIENQ